MERLDDIDQDPFAVCALAEPDLRPLSAGVGREGVSDVLLRPAPDVRVGKYRFQEALKIIRPCATRLVVAGEDMLQTKGFVRRFEINLSVANMHVPVPAGDDNC